MLWGPAQDHRRYKLVSGGSAQSPRPVPHSWIRPWLYEWVPLTLSASPPCARQLLQYYRPPQAPTNKVLPLLPAPPLLQAPPYFNQEPRPSSNPAPSPVLRADPALFILGTPPPIRHPRPVPGGPAPAGLRGRGRAATFGGIRLGGRFPAPGAELAPALPPRSQLRRARSRAPRSGVAEAPPKRQGSPARSEVPRPRARKAGGAVTSQRGTQDRRLPSTQSKAQQLSEATGGWQLGAGPGQLRPVVPGGDPGPSGGWVGVRNAGWGQPTWETDTTQGASSAQRVPALRWPRPGQVMTTEPDGNPMGPWQMTPPPRVKCRPLTVLTVILHLGTNTNLLVTPTGPTL